MLCDLMRNGLGGYVQFFHWRELLAGGLNEIGALLLTLHEGEALRNFAKRIASIDRESLWVGTEHVGAIVSLVATASDGHGNQ